MYRCLSRDIHAGFRMQFSAFDRDNSDGFTFSDATESKIRKAKIRQQNVDVIAWYFLNKYMRSKKSSTGQRIQKQRVLIEIFKTHLAA